MQAATAAAAAAAYIHPSIASMSMIIEVDGSCIRLGKSVYRLLFQERVNMNGICVCIY